MCDLLTWCVRFMSVNDFSDSLVTIYWERAVLLALLVCRVNLDGRLSACTSIPFDICGWMLTVSVLNHCPFLSSLKQDETKE